ncbi:MAG: hypothetical protein NTV36_03025 [Candidatus Staskawiczbacteria bacterium]|nr:hypothetical protein [Candidatus Staskawiczbacteria bacterium]
MRFCDLKYGYFVVITPDKPSLLLVKDTMGGVRYVDYTVAEDLKIAPDTEVQPIFQKKFVNLKRRTTLKP